MYGAVGTGWFSGLGFPFMLQIINTWKIVLYCTVLRAGQYYYGQHYGDTTVLYHSNVRISASEARNFAPPAVEEHLYIFYCKCCAVTPGSRRLLLPVLSAGVLLPTVKDLRFSRQNARKAHNIKKAFAWHLKYPE